MSARGRTEPRPTFRRDGIDFRYRDEGEGTPFVFQHGLGGDLSQPFGLVHPPDGFRMLAFDARGHGETRPLGDESKLSIADTADDLGGLLDHLGIERVIVGGISFGAAVALNFARRYPVRTSGLILSRPAWLDAPSPPNVQTLPRIADLIRRHGAKAGRALFRESAEYQSSCRDSPDAAQSLLNQFDNPRAEDAVARLERIPTADPGVPREAWGTIRMPTLVLANRLDPIHPWEYAETLAAAIPGAELVEVTPKSVSFGRHADDVLAAVNGFLRRHWPEESEPS